MFVHIRLQTFYIITNRGEAFLAQRREDLFLACVCFKETFQSVHQIICELFSYWISPPSQLLPRLSFWAYLHAPDLSNLPVNLSSHLSIKPCCWQINISNYILTASCSLDWWCMQSVFQPKLEENTNLCSPLFLGKSGKVKFLLLSSFSHCQN